MPVWIMDPPGSLTIIALMILVGLVALWFREPSRRNLRVMMVGGGLIGLFLLSAWVLESPREQAVRRVKAMAAATVNRDYDALASHVADTFRYKNSLDKSGLRQAAQNAERIGDWSGADVWDFDRNDYREIDANTIEIGFLAQARGIPQAIFWCRARFTRTKEGAYLLSGIQFFNALQRDRGPEETIPGMG